MPIRFNTCPHCDGKFMFKIEIENINKSQYPAPVYIVCKSCKKLSTFYVDSLLRISYKELEKKPGGITTIQTE
ncbi:MAG: hypothetical protein Lokiarch_30080 [Candidatus Lokiarchaeum sp. GC14_75]|nr:MAG: hypothetical protein Lokiarch_30080 [Candidatus Lokiarchaeum sp. GC14_75]